MERTKQQIEEQIEKLEQAMKVTRARNGIAHYRERISGLKGELMLLQASSDRTADEYAGYADYDEYLKDATGIH
jgi:acetolactate synthase small subunit